MTFLDKKTSKSIPITPVTEKDFPAWMKKQDKKLQVWLKTAGFRGLDRTFLRLPDEKGNVSRVIFGVGKNKSLYTYACLPEKLADNPDGYYIDTPLTKERANEVAFGWAMGRYDFNRYKTGKKDTRAKLVWPAGADKAAVKAAVEATCLVRDLINTPSNDLGPAEIAAAAAKLAKAAKNASLRTIVGKELLKKNYPTIFAVGKGSAREPRLIDFRWGKSSHPRVTLVGKGVAFDTGGLNIKDGNNMSLMKKDMGGAAHVLGLAQMIIAAKLPLRLRVLIPAVENSIGSRSFRPSDVIKTRKGITVEIGDTDAEGRLVLCDALAEASEEKPDLLIDFATLTGAARVALGPDLPVLFCNDKKTAQDLLDAGVNVKDPLWELPLWQPYNDMLESEIADTNNVGGKFAGAITAALYLEKFVGEDIPWVHIDTYGWIPNARPGRPEGGEAYGMRAVFTLLKNRFGKRK